MVDPVSLIGIGLAWKGIVDFFDLVVDYLRDDVEDRDSLRLRAQCAKKSCVDWGVAFGIDDEANGDFHKFDEERKMLIRQVIKSQMKATLNVLKMLERYNADASMVSRDGRSFERFISEAKVRIRRSANKVKWNTVHRKDFTGFVDAMEKHVQCLKDLTYFPAALPKRQDTLELLFEEVKSIKLELQQKLHASLVESPGSNDDKVIQAAISTSIDSINSYELIRLVREYSDQACYQEVDSRIVDGLHQWWQDKETIFLCIETMVATGDNSGLLACAAMYACANQPKLIYLFDPMSKATPLVQAADMIYSLIHQSLSYLGGAPLPTSNVEMNDTSPESLKKALDFFRDILPQLYGTLPSASFLLVLEGLNEILLDADVAWIGQQFLQILKTAAGAAHGSASSTAKMKVLLVGSGRSEAFEPGDSKWDLLSVLDAPMHSSILFHRLSFLF